jgi:hypothetical protein
VTSGLTMTSLDYDVIVDASFVDRFQYLTANHLYTIVCVQTSSTVVTQFQTLHCRRVVVAPTVITCSRHLSTNKQFFARITSFSFEHFSFGPPPISYHCLNKPVSPM